MRFLWEKNPVSTVDVHHFSTVDFFFKLYLLCSLANYLSSLQLHSQHCSQLLSACTFVQANLERKPNPKEALSNFLRSWNIVVFFANGNNVLLKYKYVLNICYVQDVVPVIVI